MCHATRSQPRPHLKSIFAMRPHRPALPPLRSFAPWFLALGLLSVLQPFAPSAFCFAACIPTPGATASELYTVTLNGQPLFVEHFKDIHYARFVITPGETVEIKITVPASAPLAAHVLSPVSYDIRAQRDGATLTFALGQPRNLVLQIPGLEKLFLFADAPEKNPPKPGDPGVVNVLDYVKDNTGRTNVRDQIQRALDAVAKRPDGGTLYFPPGVYRTGTLVIRSRTTVYVADGALIQATDNPGDFYNAAAMRPKDVGLRNRGPLLFIANAENSRLTGRGTIDRNGTRIRAKVRDHPRILNVVRSKNCEISDLVFRDSGGFNIHIGLSENIVCRGYKIINDLALSNQDGTDPDSSKNITIDNVFMYTSDDAVAVKADLGPCSRVLVQNCVFWTKKSALKIGSDPNYGAREIVFRNNDVLHADRAIAVYSAGGYVDGAHYIDNRSEQVGGDSKRQLIVIQVSKRPEKQRDGAPYVGCIRNIEITRYLAYLPGPEASFIGGNEPAHNVTGVKFTDCYLGTKPIASPSDASIAVDPFAKDITFVTTGSPAFDALKNLQRDDPPPLPQYPPGAKPARRPKTINYP